MKKLLLLLLLSLGLIGISYADDFQSEDSLRQSAISKSSFEDSFLKRQAAIFLCVDLTSANIAIQNERFWEALIAIKVKSYWNYSGADDDWSCNVMVHQKDGKVLTVNIQDCKKGSNALMEDDKVRAFMNSIERAVYKASPLTIGPDEEIFDRQVQFRFSAN